MSAQAAEIALNAGTHFELVRLHFIHFERLVKLKLVKLTLGNTRVLGVELLIDGLGFRFAREFRRSIGALVLLNPSCSANFLIL